MKKRKLEQLVLEFMAEQAKARPAKRRPAKPAPGPRPRVSTKTAVQQPAPRRIVKISSEALAAARRAPARIDTAQIFRPAVPPPGVVPVGQGLAMDEALRPDLQAWAVDAYPDAIAEGMAFLGFPYLAELAQRPEFRRMSETLATQMTRKWIKLHSIGEEDDKAERIDQIKDAMERYAVRDKFRELAEHDGFFGRGHLYFDFGSTNDPDELKTPIGDGTTSLSKSKCRRRSLKRLRTVEPIWCYPANYNSSDPLAPGWYRPDMWFVMGKQVHASRLLTFVGREVPDLLKPAYAFGGLSLSQMAKPYVDNWLNIRQNVADTTQAFSTMVLKTVMASAVQAGGEDLFRRVDFFNEVRNNRGTMVIDKETEDFDNVSAPLGTLDMLQAQAQEHMAAVSGIPLIFLLGISPAGLNASSEGEIRVFYDWITAYQELLFRKNLTKVINFIQLSEFGSVDPEITFSFEPLWSMDEKAKAELKKLEAETAQIDIDAGVIRPEERRKVLASDPESPFASIDPDDVPDLLEEEQAGLEPNGAAVHLAEQTAGPAKPDAETEADETQAA